MLNMATANGLTEHDLQERRNYVTASDAAAIMGTSPWKTKWDVWLEKCVEMKPVKPTPAMLWGQLLEDDIIAYAEARLQEHYNCADIRATRVGIRRKHRNGVMSCTLDAVLRGGPFTEEHRWAVEAKTHAVVHRNVNLDEWGDEEWTDAVPPHYRDQCCAQMACAELEGVFMVLAVGHSTPTMYCLERQTHMGRISEVEIGCCDFWDRHILTNTPPSEGGPTLDTVRRVAVPVENGRIAEIDDEKLERSKALAAQLTAIKEQKDAIDAAIRAVLIGAEKAVSPKGHAASITSYTRKAYQVEEAQVHRLNINLNVPKPPRARR